MEMAFVGTKSEAEGAASRSAEVEEFMDACSALGLVGDVRRGRWGGIWWASMKSASGADARFLCAGRRGTWMRTRVARSAEAACLGMLVDMKAGRMSVEVGTRTFSVPQFSCAGELRMKAMLAGI